MLLSCFSNWFIYLRFHCVFLDDENSLFTLLLTKLALMNPIYVWKKKSKLLLLMFFAGGGVFNWNVRQNLFDELIHQFINVWWRTPIRQHLIVPPLGHRGGGGEGPPAVGAGHGLARTRVERWTDCRATESLESLHIRIRSKFCQNSG